MDRGLFKHLQGVKMQEGIGLSPGSGAVPGKTPEERIKKFTAQLKTEDAVSIKDAGDMERAFELLKAGDLQKAEQVIHSMDTAVRDEFIRYYTNDGKDKKALQALRKALPDWGIYERYKVNEDGEADRFTKAGHKFFKMEEEDPENPTYCDYCEHGIATHQTDDPDDPSKETTAYACPDCIKRMNLPVEEKVAEADDKKDDKKPEHEMEKGEADEKPKEEPKAEEKPKEEPKEKEKPDQSADHNSKESKLQITPELVDKLIKKLNVDPTKTNIEQLRRGIEVELEHGVTSPSTNVTDDDPDMTAKIALAHINELPDYYTRLDRMEQEGKAGLGEAKVNEEFKIGDEVVFTMHGKMHAGKIKTMSGADVEVETPEGTLKATTADIKHGRQVEAKGGNDLMISVAEEDVTVPLEQFIQSLGFTLSGTGMGSTEWDGKGDQKDIVKKIEAKYPSIKFDVLDMKDVMAEARARIKNMGRIAEAIVKEGKGDKFWLVTNPTYPDSELVDVMGNEAVTAVQIGRIIIGGGHDLQTALQRWEKEEPAIYPESMKAEAEKDAKERMGKGTKESKVNESNAVDVAAIKDAIGNTVGSAVAEDYLTYTEGTSNKYHQFAMFKTKDGYAAGNAYGRIGKTQSVIVFARGDEASVRSAYDKKVASKTKKGYQAESKVSEAEGKCACCGATLSPEEVKAGAKNCFPCQKGNCDKCGHMEERKSGHEIVLSAAEGAPADAVKKAIELIKDYAKMVGVKITATSTNSVTLDKESVAGPGQGIGQVKGEIKRIAAGQKVNVDQMVEGKYACKKCGTHFKSDAKKACPQCKSDSNVEKIEEHKINESTHVAVTVDGETNHIYVDDMSQIFTEKSPEQWKEAVKDSDYTRDWTDGSLYINTQKKILVASGQALWMDWKEIQDKLAKLKSEGWEVSVQVREARINEDINLNLDMGDKEIQITLVDDGSMQVTSVVKGAANTPAVPVPEVPPKEPEKPAEEELPVMDKVAEGEMGEAKVAMGPAKIVGTGLQGYFPDSTTYADLVKVFGEPNAPTDAYKVDAEWQGTIDGDVFTIYNYKTGKNYMGDEGLPTEAITDWHIGGKKKDVAAKLVAYFDKAKTGKGVKEEDRMEEKSLVEGADLYAGEEYFRDSYNESSVLWQMGLSWWRDVMDKIVDKEGIMDATKLLAMIKDKPLKKEDFEAGDKYFIEKKDELIKFLEDAIKNKTEVIASL